MVMMPEVKFNISLPKEVKGKYENYILTIKGPNGELSREFKHDKIKLTLSDNEIDLYLALPKRKEYSLIGTWNAHIKNMITGATKGFEYQLKIVYAHFPIKVSVKGNNVLIENFLGEKRSRSAEILGQTKVNVKTDTLVLTGPDIEKVSQTAANIEIATKIKGFDPRVFQDGIYIIKKG